MGLVDDELHVIDEVEEDDVSQEEVTDEKGLVDDERQSDLSVSTGMSTVSHAAVHNVESSMGRGGDDWMMRRHVIDEVEEDDVWQEEMIGDELHVIDEVEEDDVSQEEVTDEKGLVDDERQSVLSVSTGMSTVSHAAVHKELVGMLLMKDDDEDNVESSMAEEEMIGEEEMGLVDDEDNVESSMAEEEMIGEEEMGLVDDELNVIDEESEVEEDDDSHEGVTDEEVLVDGVLAVRTGMSTVSHAAVHKELLWCHHDDEDNVVDEESEVEEEDVFHEEMTDEEDDVQHGVLAVRTGMSTVIHAAVHKVHDALAVMTREFMVIRAAVYKVCTADPQLSSALRAVQTGRCRAADGGRRERTLWQVIVFVTHTELDSRCCC